MQDIRNEIVLETRFRLLFVFVAIVAVGRLFYNLVIAPWLSRRRERRTRTRNRRLDHRHRRRRRRTAAQ